MTINELALKAGYIPFQFTTLDTLRRFADLIRAEEREACAKLCEAEAEKWEGKDGPVCFEARLCSYAIRARGKK